MSVVTSSTCCSANRRSRSSGSAARPTTARTSPTTCTGATPRDARRSRKPRASGSRASAIAIAASTCGTRRTWSAWSGTSRRPASCISPRPCATSRWTSCSRAMLVQRLPCSRRWSGRDSSAAAWCSARPVVSMASHRQDRCRCARRSAVHRWISTRSPSRRARTRPESSRASTGCAWCGRGCSTSSGPGRRSATSSAASRASSPRSAPGFVPPSSSSATSSPRATSSTCAMRRRHCGCSRSMARPASRTTSRAGARRGSPTRYGC